MNLVARALLARAPGFKDCPPDVLDALVELGRSQVFARGDCICSWGEASTELCIVVEGILDSGRIRPDGQRYLVALLLSGDLMGLMHHVDGLGQPYDVWARSQGTLLFVPTDAINELCQRYLVLGVAVQIYLSFRCRLLCERLAGEMGMPLTVRFAALLLLLGRLHGQTQIDDPTVRIDVKLSQTDWADWLGASRQSVNAAIKQMETAGLVRFDYGGVRLLKLAALAAQAQQGRAAPGRTRPYTVSTS